MYTKSTLFALMAFGLVAAIPLPHEPISLPTALPTELAHKTPTTSVPGYTPTSSEIAATVTVPGHQQNAPNADAATSTSCLVSSDSSIPHPADTHAVVQHPDVAAPTPVDALHPDSLLDTDPQAPHPDSVSPTHVKAPHPTELNAHPDTSVSSASIYTSTQVHQDIAVSTHAPQVAAPTHPGREGGASVPAVENPKVPTVTDPSVPSSTGTPSVEHPGIKKPGTDAPSAVIPGVGGPTGVPSVEHPELSKPSTTVEHAEIKPTETAKIPGTEAPSLEHPEGGKPGVGGLPVDYSEVLKPGVSAPSLEHQEIKPTDVNIPSESEAHKTSKTDIPSPTIPAEVQKPSADAPSVEHSDIKPTTVAPGVSVPTVTDVKKPEDGNAHGNAPSLDHPSVSDITNLGGGDHNDGDHAHHNVPSVTHPSAPEVTKTNDQGHKVPEVSPSAPSHTTTSVPELQNVHHPSGTPEVGGVKDKTEGDSPNPGTGDLPIPDTDGISVTGADGASEPSTGDIPLSGTDGIGGKGKGKGKKGKNVKGKGSGEFDHTHGSWEAETEGGRDGVKTEAEHSHDD